MNLTSTSKQTKQRKHQSYRIGNKEACARLYRPPHRNLYARKCDRDKRLQRVECPEIELPS